ncbi:unnamed protein product [Pieris macdunnoughi]|uniref:Uncharacterized protein n=1 Tax=Pieris macdunnoughi TaxID=345717 RepID=A0A821UIB9_9NEOP|nr:unnamed protein product [Pieris macdunnoughi]
MWRRAYDRSRRRREDGPDVEGLHSIFNDRKKALQGAICDAKKITHPEVLRGLDDDPWGRPYRSARERYGDVSSGESGADLSGAGGSGPVSLPLDTVPPSMAASVVEVAGKEGWLRKSLT